MGDQDELKYLGVINTLKATSGAFKFSKEQLGWQSTDGKKLTDVFSASEVLSAEWQRSCGKGYALLKFRFKRDGGVRRFVGFRPDDCPHIKAFMKKHYSINLAEQNVSLGGWSWGDWGVDANGMEFRIKMENKIGVEIPVADVAQASTVGKNDVTLEFLEKAEAPDDDGAEVLHEMRLFFPGQGPSDPTAEAVREELVQHSSLSKHAEVIARVANIPIVAPRGKHDFEFFPSFVKIHGKTQTYTLKYKHIGRLFLLSTPTSTQEDSLLIGLEQPLGQGSAKVNWLILSVSTVLEEQVDLSKERLASLTMLTDASRKELSEHLVGKTDVVQKNLVGYLLKALTGKPVSAPTQLFLDKLNLHGGGAKFTVACVQCNHKTTQPGFLYPLRKSMLFITKPVEWIRYDTIQHVEFQAGVAQRSRFDLVVSVRGKPPVEFSQIDIAVLKALQEFFTEVGVKVLANESAGPAPGRAGTRSAGKASAAARLEAAAGADYDEDADEDFQAESDDDDFDGEDDEDDDDDVSEEEEEAPKKKRAKRR